MNNERIGLVMAMPEELRPLLASVGHVNRMERAGSTIHSFQIGRFEVSAIQSGMGNRNGTAAARMLVEHCHPEILINAGFAGSLTGEAAVGDIVLADRVLQYDNGQFHEEEPIDNRLSVQAAELIGDLPNSFHVLRGSFVTTAGITRKSELANSLILSGKIAVADMETAAVARVAAEKGIAFIGIRAISDGADEELGFSIEEITDSAFRVSIPKVLETIALKPWIVPQMVRLARNSRRAGINLADVLRRLLTKL